jgi:glutamine synthetase
LRERLRVILATFPGQIIQLGIDLHFLFTRKSKMPHTPDEVRKLATEAGVKFVDLRFVDLPGMWQHFSIPTEDLEDSLFSEGIGFDGSSIRGFQQIHESDMLLIADAETAYLDPVLQVPTLNLICNVLDPITRERYSRDPRYVAQKAEQYLKGTGIADISYWGPEAEFYIFDSVRYDQSAQSGYYYIDSREAVWNTGREETPNLGYKLRHKEGYFPTPPSDQLQDVRSEIVLALKEVGVKVEVHHHEVGTAGQGEIDMRFGPLTQMADNLQAQHDGDLHAQTDLWRQWLRHAYASELVEERHQHLL